MDDDFHVYCPRLVEQGVNAISQDHLAVVVRYAYRNERASFPSFCAFWHRLVEGACVVKK